MAAQCPQLSAPSGWRPWADADGPIPDELGKRSQALVDDQSIPLGTTESYPLPGVTTLIRLEPHMWARDDKGDLVQGCFRAAGVYLPEQSPSAAGISAEPDTASKVIAGLTIASLGVGIVATVRSLRKS